MEKNKRKVPLYKLGDYYKKGQELRNKLLKWRMDNLGEIDLSKIEYGFEELSHLDGRVQQILTPIYYLSDKKGKEEILEFAKIQEEKTKEERRNTEEGIIFELIYKYYTEQHAQPALKLITEELNKQRADLGYKTKRSSKKVSDIIRGMLKLDTKEVGHENITTIMIEDDLDRFDLLIEYYGLGSRSHLASLARLANGEKSGTKDKEGVVKMSKEEEEEIEKLFNE
jgi:hypothetical protein